jgi:DNA topoisomerase-1
MNLLIVESKTKAIKIQSYLDNTFKVISCQGHIYDLPKKELGINTNTWNLTYVPCEGKEKIIKFIKKCIKEATIVYIATDPDIEGHAIAWHLAKLIKKKYHRVMFHEITKEAVIYAIQNHTTINMNAVYAQETRRGLDRLVGYKLSPLLWKEFKNNYLSAGRVQSFALNLCVDMFNNINNYIPEIKYEIFGDFANGFKNVKCNINNLNDIKNSDWNKYKISFVIKDVVKNPSPPFITTSLQFEVYNKLNINSKQCMQLAQQLYENGLITYMRTDSYNISEKFKSILLNYIQNEYGEEYKNKRTYKTTVKNAQEAHEAIRVTDIAKKIIDFPYITNQHKQVYDLIWKRTLATQMASAIYKEYTYNITFEKIVFSSIKNCLVFDGFLKIYNIKLDDEKSFNLIETYVKLIQANLKSIIGKSPTLYNEPTLIKTLESKGIGRPSTYSNIIQTLTSKKYVIIGNNPDKNIEVEDKIMNKNKKTETRKRIIQICQNIPNVFVPTDIGININSYLLNIVPFILNEQFTKQMEEAMDEIYQEKRLKNDTMTIFWNKLYPMIS